MNPLLRSVATDFLFNENNIFSFIFSLKPLLPLEGGQRKPFSLIFSDTDSNGSSLLVNLNGIFQLILHFGWWKRLFWIIANLLLLFRAFFCQWTLFMKLNVGQFLMKSSIFARWNHFLGFLQIFLRVEAAFYG